MIYAVLSVAFPVVVLNLALIIINVIHLIKHFRSKHRGTENAIE